MHMMEATSLATPEATMKKNSILGTEVEARTTKLISLKIKRDFSLKCRVI